MDVYFPLFRKVVVSSLWREPDLVVKVFLTMLAMQDADHVVRGNAYNIGEWAKKTEAEALEALAILAAPDTKRLEPQPFDGRRVQKVEDGWLILNGDVYQELMRKANNRWYQAKWQRENRAKKKTNVPEKGAKNEEQKARDESRGMSNPSRVYVGVGVSEDEEEFELWRFGTFAEALTRSTADDQCYRIDFKDGRRTVKNVMCEQKP